MSYLFLTKSFFFCSSSICDYFTPKKANCVYSAPKNCMYSTPKKSKGRSPTPAFGKKANITMGCSVNKFYAMVNT